MSENYKPEIRVVREGGDIFPGAWVGDHPRLSDRERALLVRGVPMVGERVRNPIGIVGEVLAYRLQVEVECPTTGQYLLHQVTDCSPVPDEDEDEELVERVAQADVVILEALEDVWDALMSDRHPNMELLNDAMKASRAAIRAMKEGA